MRTSDARKRASEPPSADVGVWVRAELVEQLREALLPGKWPAWEWDMKMRDAARALVDAVERSAAGDGEATCTCPPDEFLTPSDCALHGEGSVNQFSNGEETGIPENLQAEPLCRCGRHDKELFVAGFRAARLAGKDDER